MDILVAINEFKGSLSSEELREIVTKKFARLYLMLMLVAKL